MSNLLNSGPNIYIPFVYTFRSRLVRLSEKISWFIVYPLLVAVPCYFEAALPIDSYLNVFFLSLVAWQSIYEIGYLYNDSLTIRNESDPTLRFSREILESISARIPKAVFVRLVVTILILYWLWQHYGASVSVGLFAIAICLSQGAFFLHNKLRSRMNILSYALLSATKYLAFPLLVFGLSRPMLLAFYIVIFTLPRTMEHAVKVKYGLRWLKFNVVGELEVFRVKYYLILVGLYTIIFLFSTAGERSVIVFLMTSISMLVYRMVIWMVIKTGRYRRSKFRVHDWSQR